MAPQTPPGGRGGTRATQRDRGQARTTPRLRGEPPEFDTVDAARGDRDARAEARQQRADRVDVDAAGAALPPDRLGAGERAARAARDAGLLAGGDTGARADARPPLPVIDARTQRELAHRAAFDAQCLAVSQESVDRLNELDYVKDWERFETALEVRAEKYGSGFVDAMRTEDVLSAADLPSAHDIAPPAPPLARQRAVRAMVLNSLDPNGEAIKLVRALPFFGGYTRGDDGSLIPQGFKALRERFCVPEPPKDYGKEMRDFLATKWPAEYSAGAYLKHYADVESAARKLHLDPQGDTASERQSRAMWWPLIAAPPSTSLYAPAAAVARASTRNQSDTAADRRAFRDAMVKEVSRGQPVSAAASRRIHAQRAALARALLSSDDGHVDYLPAGCTTCEIDTAAVGAFAVQAERTSRPCVRCARTHRRGYRCTEPVTCSVCDADTHGEHACWIKHGVPEWARVPASVVVQYQRWHAEFKDGKYVKHKGGPPRTAPSRRSAGGTPARVAGAVATTQPRAEDYVDDAPPVTVYPDPVVSASRPDESGATGADTCDPAEHEMVSHIETACAGNVGISSAAVRTAGAAPAKPDDEPMRDAAEIFGLPGYMAASFVDADAQLVAAGGSAACVRRGSTADVYPSPPLRRYVTPAAGAVIAVATIAVIAGLACVPGVAVLTDHNLIDQAARGALGIAAIALLLVGAVLALWRVIAAVPRAPLMWATLLHLFSVGSSLPRANTPWPSSAVSTLRQLHSPGHSATYVPWQALKDGTVGVVKVRLSMVEIAARHAGAVPAPPTAVDALGGVAVTCIVDSGADMLIVNDARAVAPVRSSPPLVVVTADGNTTPVELVGASRLVLPAESGDVVRTCGETLVCSAFPRALWSVPHAGWSLGASTIFGSRKRSGCAIVFDTGERVPFPPWPPYLLTLRASPATSAAPPAPPAPPAAPPVVASAAATAVTGDDAVLWHRRLMHRGASSMSYLGGKVDGAPLHGAVQLPCTCDACKEGKLKRRPMPQHERVSSRCGQLTHSDILYCSVPAAYFTDCCYAICFVDDYSRFKWVVFMVNRTAESVIAAFKVWRAVMKYYGHDVSGMVSDGGPEYVSQALFDFCDEVGVRRFIATRYSPESDGVSEACFGVHEPLVRAVMRDTGFGPPFWALMLQQSVNFVGNMVPTRSNGGVPPIELVSSRRADLSILRAPGARCWVIKPRTEREYKFDTTGRPAVVCGNSELYKGWIVYYPDTHTFGEEIHVEFDETCFPLRDAKSAAVTPAPRAAAPPPPPPRPTVTITPPPVIVAAGGDTPHATTAEATTRITPAPRVAAPSPPPPRPTVAITPPPVIVAAGGDTPRAGRQVTSPEATRRLARQGLQPVAEPPPRRADSVNTAAQRHARAAAQRHARHRARLDAARAEVRYHTAAFADYADRQPADEWQRTPDGDDSDDGGSVVLHVVNGTAFVYKATVKQRTRYAEIDGGIVALAVPRNRREMERHPYAPQFEEASIREMNSQSECESWELVLADSLPEGTNVITCRWVYDVKTDANRKLERFKARLVARGFEQIEGEDYFEVYAGVVRFSTLRLFLAFCCMADLRVTCCDVSTAYLQAWLSEDVYMEQPEGFVRCGPSGERLVCKLKRALYGLKQSAREWGRTLREWLLDYGFVRGGADAQMYVLHGDGGGLLVVLVYVDDLIIGHSSADMRAAFIAAITDRFKMTDLGAVSKALGATITQDVAAGTIQLSLSNYISDAGRRFEIANPRSCDAPVPPRLLRRCAAARPDADEIAAVTDTYAAMVGVILFIASAARPDAAFAAHVLSCALHAPSNEHLVLARHVLSYLVRTRDMCITYRKGDGSFDVPTAYLPSRGDRVSGLHAASDADHAVGPSVTAAVFFLAGAAVGWLVRKQRVVALSTPEAEFYALSTAVAEALYFRNLLVELGVLELAPTCVFCDSRGARLMAADCAPSARTRHIPRRWYFTHHHTDAGDVTITAVAGSRNPANVLSKPLVGGEFARDRAYLLGEA